MNPLIQYLVLPGLALVVVGFILALVIMAVNKIFNIQPKPIVSALVTVVIFFFAVEAFAVPVVCISDEPRVYKFDVEAVPFMQLDEWHTGKKKGLKMVFVVGYPGGSVLQYRCEGCAVKFKRTHSLKCKQGLI